MQAGLFLMPSHPPTRSIRAGAAWDLEVIRRADALGYSEVWIGEHFTTVWEPCPAPDLLVAQALLDTHQIRIGPGGHILPYHHPAELAHRIAYLDHLSNGRLNLGVSAGGVPSDFVLFDVDAHAGEHRRMLWEALDAILTLWSADDACEIDGEHWTIRRPPRRGDYGFHLRPLQDPHPPIGITAISPASDSLRICGERGWLPMSLNLNAPLVASHWHAYAAGAAAAGRTPDPSAWRVVRDVFVAETDDAAYEGASTFMRQTLADFLIPQFAKGGRLIHLKADPSDPDAVVDADYVLRSNCIVGSIDTVVARLSEFVDAVGEFGVLVQLAYDYADDPEPWFRSMELLATEVIPQFDDAR
jgi:alkanesulfonate monooxygenase SsuD/methylene tetrahydromethanopterin reductase-like flavin-dependent oxidoreductase (luciferase family)